MGWGLNDPVPRRALKEKKREERSFSLLEREETTGGKLLFGGEGKYNLSSKSISNEEQDEQGPNLRAKRPPRDSERSECAGDSALAPGGPTLRVQ